MAVVAIAPFVLLVVLVGQAGPSARLANGWDIPAQLVPVFVEAGDTAQIPWTLLAGIASVATDFGRHAPDGVTRESIYPAVRPAITVAAAGGTGAGLFLVSRSPVDPQDVRAAAGWLSGLIHAAVPGTAPSLDGDGSAAWKAVVATLPLTIDRVAPRASDPAPAGSLRQFAEALVRRLSAPPSAANIDAIVSWAGGEGSCARHNPLDTTQPAPGATPYNTLPGGGHVWNYRTSEQGLQATAETLNNGLYEPILAALRTDAGVAAVERAERSSPWGTQRFGDPTYSAAQCPPPPDAPVAADAPAPAPIDGLGPIDIPAQIVARAAQYAAIASAAAGAGRPMVPSRYVLPVDQFWYQTHPDWFARPHHDFPAVDIPVPAGTPVYAVTAGQVVAADEASGQTSCGHDVRLKGDDGVTYTYCHGSQVLVAAGDRVAPGSILLRSGWSGAVVPAGPLGAHLHFQMNVPGLVGPSCPQPALAAWARGQPFDPQHLPITGCVSGHLP
jgi:murein DD-endopeptidase MepM/ murein hydrolase activator NlpD